jgi:hypothetical protein
MSVCVIFNGLVASSYNDSEVFLGIHSGRIGRQGQPYGITTRRQTGIRTAIRNCICLENDSRRRIRICPDCALSTDGLENYLLISCALSCINGPFSPVPATARAPENTLRDFILAAEISQVATRKTPGSRKQEKQPRTYIVYRALVSHDHAPGLSRARAAKADE